MEGSILVPPSYCPEACRKAEYPQGQPHERFFRGSAGRVQELPLSAFEEGHRCRLEADRKI